MLNHGLMPPFYREEEGIPWDANSWRPKSITRHKLIICMESHGLRCRKRGFSYVQELFLYQKKFEHHKMARGKGERVELKSP